MFIMLASTAVAQTPLETTCASVKGLYQANACCDATSAITISDTMAVCPKLDTLITYPMKFGNWTPCPAEEFYTTYSAENLVAPGYMGCVSESKSTPCGWYDYYDYELNTKACVSTGSLTTAMQTVRGGSPTMTADMLMMTKKTTLPTISFPALPMAYPAGRDNSLPEYAELEVVWKKFMMYFGSQLDLTAFDSYPTYGAEMGMVGMIAIKVLELARTTCNRNFYAFLEAPAYGYDWSLAISLVDARSSSFYAGSECTCFAAGTCLNPGKVTITQRGWAPSRAISTLPTEAGDDGVQYSPTSTAANSPWIQTNVIPGNPIGRFQACKAPKERCLCDGVYWYPSFLPPNTVMQDFKCYAWAFSTTKIYSAQLRAGAMFVSDAPTARSAATSIWGKMLSIGNGLMSYMQVHGQIQIMNKIMEEPYSSPTSWLSALSALQYAKWDAMMEGLGACESAGILKKTAEQPVYSGAYIFSHMMPAYQGLATDIGAASADFFKSVVGYDHFNYNWGWRGEDPMNYGVEGTVNTYDFIRTHLFRALEVYTEESRRLKLVCGDLDAKVTNQFLSVNEWKALRSADVGRRRKLTAAQLSEKVDVYDRARQIQEAAPRMKIGHALQHAEMTDPHSPCVWEYGMPEGMCD